MVNFLPNDKILDLSKLNALADDNLNANNKLKFGLERVENIAGKGENAGYQHFLLFPQCFQKASSRGLLKVRIVRKMVKEVQISSDGQEAHSFPQLDFFFYPLTFPVYSAVVKLITILTNKCFAINNQ